MMNYSVHCCLLGVGSQFLAIAFGIITMALLGMFNVHRHGEMNSAACFLYAITSGTEIYLEIKYYVSKCYLEFIYWET